MSIHTLPVRLLLNVGHSIDHMFLLIFATAVTTITLEFGFASWVDLMPYSVGAFVLFGLGSLPSGRLGDLWGRRNMMIIFLIGIGCAAILVAFTNNAWQMAAALALLGLFASIYHPVGIPMLVQQVSNPGLTIGINGLAGNLGIATAALITGFFVKWFGWRYAFAVPGLLSIVLGFLFMYVCPKESQSPSKKSKKSAVSVPPALLAHLFMVMTAVAVTSSLIFNFTTNGNFQLLSDRFIGLIEDPATLGAMLAVIYTIASFAQVVVGNLIDRLPMKKLQLWIAIIQIPLLVFAAYTDGWWLFVSLLAVMIFVFGAIPFTDAMIVRYVDDRLRSRVTGMRLTVSFGISSLAVWLLGPLVKDIGFVYLIWLMVVIALIKVLAICTLPSEKDFHVIS
jgi:MFS family permease